MDSDDAVTAPPVPEPVMTEVEITVAGHTIAIKTSESLEDACGYALSLFEQTQESARRQPVGFDVTGGVFELQSPSSECGEEVDSEREVGRLRSPHPAA